VSPVNNGPQHLVFDAAIDSLDRWVRTGTTPATGNDITVSGGQLQRDQYGNVLGGVRTPQVDVPLGAYSGVGNTGTTPAGTLFCRLFGTSTPLPTSVVDSLYRNNGAYVSLFAQAANATYKNGFFVADDLDAIKADAAQSHRVFALPPSS
jgi:hypothetical protein